MIQDFIHRLSQLIGALVGGPPQQVSSLDRSIAAAANSHAAARRALAVAIAEEEREADRRNHLSERRTDLEGRAVEALRSGREDLAGLAAEEIAAMETEIEASAKASERFSAEAALARREVDAQRRRLGDLDRGRRLARVGAALNSTSPHPQSGLDSFAEAEASLVKMHTDNHDARAVREEMAPPADRLIEQMAEAGIGRALRVLPSEVLLRLRAKAASDAPSLAITSSQNR